MAAEAQRSSGYRCLDNATVAVWGGCAGYFICGNGNTVWCDNHQTCACEPARLGLRCSSGTNNNSLGGLEPGGRIESWWAAYYRLRRDRRNANATCETGVAVRKADCDALFFHLSLIHI